MAVVVALFLLGGVTQAANVHAATSTSAVELGDASLDLGDLGVSVEPVQAVAPIRQTLTIVMPSLDQPMVSPLAPRTFRPPRG